MRKENRTVLAWLGGLLFCLGSMGSALALVPNQPGVKTYAGVPYISGGIGLDERETLRSLGKEYNLQLSFALTAGNYLSDVEVLILDDKGKTVLEAVTQGPWFFTKLPAGTYRIRAKTLGQSLEHVAHVTQSGQTRLAFSWAGGR